MNKIYLLLVGCFLMLNAGATDTPKKQKVYSIVKQKKTVAWYQEQMNLWEKEVELHPQDPEAWQNVYTATRMIKILGGEKTQKDLDQVVDKMEKNIPDSFEFNFVKYWNGNNKTEYFSYLKKAYEIAPERPETYPDFLTYYELKRDKGKTKEFSKMWFASNDISAGLYAWNYNMLMSCDENAILMTHGDNDTYPAMILQGAKDVRTDVAILNFSLMYVEEYRNKYFNELGIPEFQLTKKVEGYEGYSQAICEHIRKHTNRPFYYASSVSPKLYEDVKDDLYIVGLAFKYSKKSFDNVAVLKRNYEKKFLKDYMKIELNNDISQGVVDNMNGSYLMPFITLHNHYEEAEDDAEMMQIEKFVNQIAEKTGQTEEVEQIISPSGNNVVSYVIDDPRNAYWGFLKINDSLHVSQREIENEMYDRFLEDLLLQQRYDDLMIAKKEKVDWESLLKPMYKGLSYEEYFEHGKPDHDMFPVCNVSYEAALLYCEWLTNIYNNLHHRKKQFKKVKFRLPTEEEWEMLARADNNGKKKDLKYTWGYRESENGFEHDQIVNENGCYLANIQANRSYGKKDEEDEKSCPNYDGGIFPVKTSSYHPNDYGLYCIIGNVAEMVQEKGVAKGGGWNTLPEDAIITAREKYEGPNPNVGFRVVMDVIEEFEK